jgi:hypothetical protein
MSSYAVVCRFVKSSCSMSLSLLSNYCCSLRKIVRELASLFDLHVSKNDHRNDKLTKLQLARWDMRVLSQSCSQNFLSKKKRGNSMPP